MIEYGVQVTGEELLLLINRMDLDKDGKLGFLDFKQSLQPQSKYIFQQNLDEGI